MNLEEATIVSIKVSTQLMYHSMNQIDKLIVERVCLTKTEGKNAIFQKQLKDNDTRFQKELKAKDSTIFFLNKEIKRPGRYAQNS